MSNTKKIKAKTTHAQELMKIVGAMMQKHNIPAIVVVGDYESKRTGVVIDEHDNYYDINKSILMDAMCNASGKLMNLIFDCVATIIALSPDDMHDKFENYIKSVRDADKEKSKIIKNTAEA